MANVGEAIVTIRTDSKDAERELGGFGERIGGKLQSVGAGLTAGLTVPIIGAGVAATKMAADVDQGLREVNTLFGQTGKAAEASFGELKSGVADLSNEIGVAQDVLVGGLYQAISAGVPRENAFTFMEVAAKAAIAGVTDTETAVDGLTTTLNAFGLDASQAEAVADSMFTAVKGGKTTFDELSNSLFQVAPAAAAAGVQFTDVNAALAALTASGTPTSVATTQIRQAIVELTKGGTLASDVFEKVTGKTFPEFVAQGGNLQEALFEIKKEADANGKSMLDMFGSVEAGQAALSLTGTAAEKFTSELEAQANAAGATDKAFSEMEKSGARKFEKAMTQLKNAAIAMGAVILPVVASIAETVGKAVSAFGGLPESIQTTVVVVAGLAAALGPVLFVVGHLITGIGGLVKAFQAVMVVMRLVQLLFVANPFGLLIAAVIGLTVLIVTNWDTIKNAISTAWDWVKEKTSGWGDAMQTILTIVLRAFLAIITGGLSEVVMAIVRNWDNIKSKTSEVWNSITGAISGAWNAIKSAVFGAIADVATSINNAWNNARNATTNAWNDIKSAVASAIGGLLGEVRAIPGKITSALGNLGSLLWSAGKDVVQGMINGVKSMGRTLINAIVGLIPGPIRGVVKKALGISSPSKVFKGFGQNIMEGLVVGLQDRSRNLSQQMARIADQVTLGDLSLTGTALATNNQRPLSTPTTTATAPVYEVSVNFPDRSMKLSLNSADPMSLKRFIEQLAELLATREASFG